MKKILVYLSLVVLLLTVFLTDCKKKPELKVYLLEITEENVVTTTNNATITAKYSFPTEIRDIKVVVSKDSNSQNASVAEATLENNSLSATIDNLNAGTNYYYCFRYSNGMSTVDTDKRSFTTQSVILPTVTTTTISNITPTTATGGGNITSDGGANVTARGVCWSTSHNPTVSGSHTTNGSGTGSFTSSMTGLTANTTYYVRAYATNSAGTAYGSEVSFVTEQVPTYNIVVSSNPTNAGNVSGGGNYQYGASCTVHATANSGYTFTNWTENGSQVSTNANYTFTVNGSRNLVANFTYNGGGNAPTGAINGLFTINANGGQVYFSQGNLQYRASTNTWRFATNQWDYVGQGNSNISSTYSGWIDLFGWGTSGWNSGSTYYHPWDSNYSSGSTYGPPGQYNLTGSYANADWGVYNPISNGGNTANQWRTLTQPEWNYVFYTRSTTSGIRYAKANVNNINGVILLPDDWSSTIFNLSNTNSSGSSFNSNTISASQWTTLESAGAVFLPAAGRRLGSVDSVGSCGYYWSASYYDSLNAYGVYFLVSNLYPDYNGRPTGQSVRLVQDAQ